MIELTDDERDDIREAFDAWGHDYTLLYPVVQQIVDSRTAPLIEELEVVTAQSGRNHQWYQSRNAWRKRALDAENQVRWLGGVVRTPAGIVN
jgi:hypothetical protein